MDVIDNKDQPPSRKKDGPQEIATTAVAGIVIVIGGEVLVFPLGFAMAFGPGADGAIWFLLSLPVILVLALALATRDLGLAIGAILAPFVCAAFLYLRLLSKGVL